MWASDFGQTDLAGDLSREAHEIKRGAASRIHRNRNEYGDGLNGSAAGNLYPSSSLGGKIILNEAEQMAMTFDVAFGKSGNNGFYMRFGQAFDSMKSHRITFERDGNPSSGL